jgi:hypothetical protein
MQSILPSRLFYYKHLPPNDRETVICAEKKDRQITGRIEQTRGQTGGKADRQGERGTDTEGDDRCWQGRLYRQGEEA